MKQLISLATFLVMAQTGCFIDPEGGDKRFQNDGGKEISTERGTSSASSGQGMCQYSLGRGCFDGYVGFKKDFYVGGRSFFNADDFASQFPKLIQVKDENGGLLVAGQDFEVEILTPIDQKSFTSGFEYELIGVMVRNGKIPDNGSFSINDLLDGVGYELRIHRPIQFRITKLSRPIPQETPESPSISDSENFAPEAKELPQGKSYCATLYQDSLIEISKGIRTYERFNDFKLYFSDQECKTRSYATTLSL
jgi:hypothetical protein